MDFLLDVNVLIARADSRHEHYQRCRRWGTGTLGVIADGPAALHVIPPEGA